ncbi:MAG: DciA family protein, partial [Terriglobia bacterium]
RNGNLTLSVSTDCWAMQLRSLTAELRDRINVFLGRPLVTRVSVRYKSGFAPVSLPESKPLPWQEDAALSQRARSLLGIETGAAPLDPMIRDVLENSFVKYFSRHPKGVC